MDIPNYSSIIGSNIKRIIDNSSYTKILEEANAIESFANEINQAQRIANQHFQPSVTQIAKAANMAIEEAKIRDEILNVSIERLLGEQRKLYQDSLIDVNKIIGDKASIGVEAALSALRNIQDISQEDIRRVHFEDLEESNLEKSDNFENFLGKLFVYTKDKISALPKGYISVQGLLNLLLQAVVVYYTIQLYQLSIKSANETEKYQEKSIEIAQKTRKDIKKFSKKIFPLLQDLKKGDGELICTVNKECPIRSEPTSDADTTARINSGSKIEIVNSLNRWYEIKYFHATDTTIKTGFIYKGHVEHK